MESTNKRGRGRPTVDSHIDDEQLLQDWRAAHAAGMSRKDFAAQRAMTPQQLERAIQRVTKRQAKNRRAG